MQCARSETIGVLDGNEKENKTKYFECEVGTTQPKTTTVTKQPIEQMQRMEESRGIRREPEWYRQHWLAKSLFSTLLLFSPFFSLHWWLLLLQHTMVKWMLQPIHMMTALSTNSVAIYDFVMHSSEVFAHWLCVDDMNARRERFAIDINICCCWYRHHHASVNVV